MVETMIGALLYTNGFALVLALSCTFQAFSCDAINNFLVNL
jgi:hypothetical protein